MAVRWLFKKVSMHHLSKKLPRMYISKVYARIEPKILMAWHWNLVNEASMLLPKYASKNFYKTNDFLKRYDKNCCKSLNCYSSAIRYVFM